MTASTQPTTSLAQRAKALPRRAQVVAVLSALALLVLVPITPAAVRIPVALAFLLVAPGLAWVGRLPVEGGAEVATVTLALSLALGVLVAEALLLIGVPGPVPAAL